MTVIWLFGFSIWLVWVFEAQLASSALPMNATASRLVYLLPSVIPFYFDRATVIRIGSVARYLAEISLYEPRSWQSFQPAFN